ncbi:C39 family peptidase [Bacillus weihaiensis]|uniref:Peptidase C39-like domain-containing protein n=1 Tax=Bacillus weihaiensis TaxID=1547283 RepID=A0A1L3MVB3_9BACI|nr:C39 family peptidase [Bacillus weihaiensis]APH06287.1 hypothetical protein A9C19_16990 [Bacillus weihaiensis]
MTNSLLITLALITIIIGALLLKNKIPDKLKPTAIMTVITCFAFFLYGAFTSPFVEKVVSRNLLPTSGEIMEQSDRKKNSLLDVPLLSQLPELPRGCEVTSLAMLLQYMGVNVGKLELAKKVDKDPTPYQKVNGQVFFGNPHVGFVGDMYDKSKPGYGVYHEPIKRLAESYLPDRIVNLTGQSFVQIEEALSEGSPVWVIVNATYKELPSHQFEEWQTPIGKITVTYHEHSVIITGYDENYVYVNDPLSNDKNKKIKKHEFRKAWEQMGKQAIKISTSKET